MMVSLPPFFPRPPFFQEEDEEEDEEELESEAFRRKMKSGGFDPDLVEMGVKVMKNHRRPVEEAFKIGAEYIKSMSK